MEGRRVRGGSGSRPPQKPPKGRAKEALKALDGRRFRRAWSARGAKSARRSFNGASGIGVFLGALREASRARAIIFPERIFPVSGFYRERRFLGAAFSGIGRFFGSGVFRNRRFPRLLFLGGVSQNDFTRQPSPKASLAGLEFLLLCRRRLFFAGPVFFKFGAWRGANPSSGLIFTEAPKRRSAGRELFFLIRRFAESEPPAAA
jgi:hypothetical protein